MYTAKINLSKGQLTKIKRASKNGRGVNVRLKNDALRGEMPIILDEIMAKKYAKAVKKGTGLVLSLTKELLEENKKDGGILPFLIPILGAIASSALSAGVSYGVNKLLQSTEKKDEVQTEGTGIGVIGEGLAPLGVQGSGVFPIGIPSGSGLFPHGIKPYNPLQKM